MKITTIEEAAATRGRKILIYGFAGSGKTTSLGTIPGKGLLVSSEGGLLALSGRAVAGDIDVVEITSMAELRDVYSTLKDGDHGYQWVALDSISEIAEVVLSAEKAKTRDPRQAYGALAEEMASVLRSFRDLPMDVVFVAKAQRVKDESTGRVMVEMMFPGQRVSAAIPYLFDEVFHLVVTEDKETGEVSRWFQTTKDTRSDCKDRSGRLDAFEPADFAVVLNKISNNNSAAKAA